MGQATSGSALRGPSRRVGCPCEPPVTRAIMLPPNGAGARDDSVAVCRLRGGGGGGGPRLVGGGGHRCRKGGGPRPREGGLQNDPVDPDSPSGRGQDPTSAATGM